MLPHLLLTIGLCASPLLVLLPVWKLDQHDNGYVCTQENEPRDEPEKPVRPLAA